MTKELPQAGKQEKTWLLLVLCLLLAVITAALYAPVRHYDFIHLDDNEYVTANPHVRAGVTFDGLGWAFRTSHSAYWHPLTWISHMIDIELWGLRAGGHHLTNAFLHTANTVLLFLVLNAMTRTVWRSAFVAALFAWHPLHVESVAWVAERKDVLSTFFWMLTMGAYVRYAHLNADFRMQNAESGKDSEKRPARAASFSILHSQFYISPWYWLTVLCFALGLMAKPMLVTLPFVLLLLDYWPLERLNFSLFRFQFSAPESRRVLLEKLPLFVLAGISSLVTIAGQQKLGAVITLEQSTPGSRVANALINYAFYLLKTVWPDGLAVAYPSPIGFSLPVLLLSVLLLSVITAAVSWSASSKPYLTVGWFWYIGTLIPIIGLIHVGATARADRFTYVPLIGIFIIAAWGLTEIAATRRWRRIAASCCAGGILLTCLWGSASQLRYWSDSIALFHHSLAVNPENAIAQNSLGFALAEQGKTNDALIHYLEALRVAPTYALAHNNIAPVLLSLNRVAEAVFHCRQALQVSPRFADAHTNLGNALFVQGKYEEALAHYQNALELKPDHPQAHCNLANVLFMRERKQEAMEHYQEALRLKPDYPDAHCHLANVLFVLGMREQAMNHYQEALRLKPDYADAHANLGNALFSENRVAEAIDHYEQALRADKNLPGVLTTLAWIHAAHPNLAFRDGAKAVELSRRAIAITGGDNPSTMDVFAAALAESGQFREAGEIARKARDLARAANQAQLANGIEKRLEFYQIGLPWRMTP